MGQSAATRALREIAEGNGSAVNDLMPLVYDELRALAQFWLDQERVGHTLSATALVNEAYLRLVGQDRAQWRDRAHFFAVAAQAIRRVLVDYARFKKRAKRGGGQRRVDLDSGIIWTESKTLDVIALNDALNELAALHDRQARIVEMRFFAGLSIDEIAEVLGAAPRTVDGDWSMARKWLKRRLAADLDA